MIWPYVARDRLTEAQGERDFWRARYHAVLEAGWVRPPEPVAMQAVEETGPPLDPAVEALIDLQHGHDTATARQVRRKARKLQAGGLGRDALLKAVQAGEAVEV